MRQLEFLETNGTGGFACGALNGELQRFWHGLLWVARRPPRDRVRLLSTIEESIEGPGGKRRFLSARCADGGWIQPDSSAAFEAFPNPTWTWKLAGGGTLTKRLFMPQGSASFVRISYRLEGSAKGVVLHLRPLLPFSVHLAAPCGDGRWRLRGEGTPDLFLFISGKPRETAPAAWLGHVTHEIEEACNDDPRQEVFAAPEFAVSLQPGAAVDLVFAANEAGLSQPPFDDALKAEADRRIAGKTPGVPDGLNRLPARLSHAAGQFITKSASGASTIMAGYPWFTDWGRDAMIALPGLCLGTGRVAEVGSPGTELEFAL